jgi:hypothetical protein
MHKSNVMRRALGVGAFAIALVFATASFAQQPGRIRGQIERAEGNALSLKQRDGTMLDVKVADDARVAALVKASLADIKNDSFIGVAGMPRPDGSIEAFSVHIFLPAQRGVVADRHFNWDAKPGSTMTNAYVESSVAEKDGQTVTVKYKDGDKKIIVTPATAITAVAPGDKAELKPGTQIIIMAADKQPDGSVLAKTLYVGRSLTPAM